nr:MAG TPA: virion morphogenesis protein [Caudoviricetes sp.]
MSVEVKLIDHGFDKIIQQALKLDGKGVKVGIRRGKGSHDGTDMLDIAVYNHFGTSTIPARPFISDCAEKNAGQIQEAQKRLVYRVYQGSLSADGALAELGAWYVNVQKGHILHGGWTPNAPATVKRKGSNKPLVDTGQLVNTVDWERS